MKICFTTSACTKPNRWKIEATKDNAEPRLLVDNLTKSDAKKMICAYTAGALLAGASVSESGVKL